MRRNLLAGGVLLAVIICVFGYVWYAQQRITTPSLPSRMPPAGYREYQDMQYRFSLFYPGNLSVSQYDEGGGAKTFVFQNTVEAEGFQIFIVPYFASQITEERFRQDEPSGVREDPTALLVGGVPAVAFFGKSPVLGDTREIWFIREGYPFEVTAPKVLGEWLLETMQSWEFL